MRYDDFLERVAAEYPKTAKQHDLRALIIPSLVAPQPLELPAHLMSEAERLVFLFYERVRAARDRSEELCRQPPIVPGSPVPSVLMSYDFHVDFSEDPRGRLKLIEINTNASMSLLTCLVTRLDAGGKCSRQMYVRDFANALHTGNKSTASATGDESVSGKKIAIVDDVPTAQKMFVEFLLYKELLEDHGAEVAILDRRELQIRKDSGGADRVWSGEFGPIDLIYNRTTDFYFEDTESAILLDAYTRGLSVITPGPYDYRLLADKNRLVEWSKDGFLESAYKLLPEEAATIRASLLRTREMRSLNPEDLWKERKKLMFKPAQAYGGKGVYRGSSISRGAFEKLLDENALAQDFVPAPTVETPAGEFKYDLRFFAYRGKINVACARLYQGQTTNATTPGGGVTAIVWR